MARYFDKIAVGETFTFNGNQWRKRSTRTAEIVNPARFAGTWFYFSKTDLCDRVAAECLNVL